MTARCDDARACSPRRALERAALGLPRIAAALLLAGSILVPQNAKPALGEPGRSVETDQARLRAKKRPAIQGQLYSVVELESASNVVREFVAPTGTVFAVAWSGRVAPELEPLLGRYAAEYQAAARAQPRVRGTRRRRVQTGQAIVETWGHMRDLHGRAYVPALLPSGVTLDEIR